MISYKVSILKGETSLNRLDDNVDVEVRFVDGKCYVATFYTIENINSLFKKNMKTGECLNGLYFWGADMVIVKELTDENIKKTVDDIIKNKEIEESFLKIS